MFAGAAIRLYVLFNFSGQLQIRFRLPIYFLKSQSSMGLKNIRLFLAIYTIRRRHFRFRRLLINSTGGWNRLFV